MPRHFERYSGPLWILQYHFHYLGPVPIFISGDRLSAFSPLLDPDAAFVDSSCPTPAATFRYDDAGRIAVSDVEGLTTITDEW